jgi:site-specific recombinase XerD
MPKKSSPVHDRYQNPLQDPHLRAYLDHVANDPLRPRTWDTFIAVRGVLRQFDDYLSEIGQTCETVEAIEFEGYLSGLLRRGLARTTVNKHLIQCRAVVHYHRKRVRRGQVPMWDFTTTVAIHMDSPRPKTFSAAEMRALFAEVVTPDEELWFLGMSLSGMRKEVEWARLMWRQVDFDGGYLELGGWDEVEGARGKGGKPRLVPLHPFLAEKLADAWNRSRDQQRYVIESQRRNYLSDSTISVRFDRLRKRSGVAGKIHMLRATFNSSLLDNGADERLVEVIMGHAPVTVNRKHYQAANWRRLEDTIRLAYRDDPFWLQPPARHLSVVRRPA